MAKKKRIIWNVPAKSDLESERNILNEMLKSEQTLREQAVTNITAICDEIQKLAAEQNSSLHRLAYMGLVFHIKNAIGPLKDIDDIPF